MIEKLFESLDEKVFTPELKEELSTQFNEAVETKAIELAEAKIAEEKEVIKAELVAEAEEKEAALLENLDGYLNKVVDDFVAEAKAQLDESIKMEKADLMVEAFESMLVAGGVDVARIVEAKDSTEAEAKLEESVEKYDTLIEENIRLEKENADLIQLGVITEMKEGLSILEQEKFEKLASLVEFTKDTAYSEKLELIKESVKSGAAETPAENLNEDVEKSAGKAYSHLI